MEKVSCGTVGLDGRCSVKAEQRKIPVAVGPMPGAYLSTETNLNLDSWHNEEVFSFFFFWTHAVNSLRNS